MRIRLPRPHSGFAGLKTPHLACLEKSFGGCSSSAAELRGPLERDFFIGSLLIRIHFIIVMIISQRLTRPTTLFWLCLLSSNCDFHSRASRGTAPAGPLRHTTSTLNPQPSTLNPQPSTRIPLWEVCSKSVTQTGVSQCSRKVLPDHHLSRALGPFRKPMPRVLGGSSGDGRFLMGEAPL